MKAYHTACAIILVLAVLSGAHAQRDSLTELDDLSSDPRTFFTNFTSSLIAVNATLLAIALVALAIAGAIALALWFLFVESQKNSGYSSGGYGQSSGYGQSYGSSGYSQYARSNNDDSYLSGFNVIQWISILQDLYEKFDYNDLECQKKVICEVMKEPDFYGASARKFKDGFQYAKYLEVLSLPDDMRELLDEYLDANARSSSQKSCDEFFKCPFSMKEAMSKNHNGNNSL